MAVDITNHKIGVALAQHEQSSSRDTNSEYVESIHNHRDRIIDSLLSVDTATIITPLPSIPYMSHPPYHPSYSSRYPHRHVAGMRRKPPRVERTIEVVTKLSQMATENHVQGVLVRWPGGGSSAGMMTGCGGGFEEELVREVEEGRLSLPNHHDGSDTSSARGDNKSDGRHNNKQSDEEGTMGYRRGRVLYFLDQCCTSSSSRNNQNNNSASSKPLFTEKSRPFAFWDSSFNEYTWMMSRHEQDQQHARPHIPAPIDRVDKYGNSLVAVDQWGRAPIFGMPPEDLIIRFQQHLEKRMQNEQERGKFYYSSKHQFSGYHDSSDEKVFKRDTGERVSMSKGLNQSNSNDNASRDQLEWSLPATYALHEFSRTHLQSRIFLPSWVLNTMTNASLITSGTEIQTKPQTGTKMGGKLGSSEEFELFGERHGTEESQQEITLGYRRTRLPMENSSSSSNGKRMSQQYNPSKIEKPNGLASLVRMPAHKLRRRNARSE